MTRGQAKPEKLSTRVPFAGLFDLKRLRQSSVFRHQMPPKAKPTSAAQSAAAAAAAAAALSGQTKDADIDANKVVSFGALKTYMDSVIQKINDNTDARFEKLTDEMNGQKKDLITVQKTVTAIATTVACNKREMREAQRAKKELVLADYDIKSTDKPGMIEEVLTLIRSFDDEVAKYEIRDLYKVGSEEFTRYVITVISEHARDRILGKAMDHKVKNFRAGLPKAERAEKARIHKLKEECHEKNRESTGAFLWDVWTPEGALNPQIVRFATADPKVRKLAAKYFPAQADKGRTARQQKKN